MLSLLSSVGLEIAAGPTRWRARQWGVACLVASATLLTWIEKRPLQALLQAKGGDVPRLLAQVADVSGNGFTLVFVSLVALLLGRWARWRAMVEAAVTLGGAGPWCWILLLLGQFALAERRPIEGGAMLLFALGGHGVSGHAAAAGLLYSPVRDVLARDATTRARQWVTACLLAWAAFIAWSRVWLGMHFVWNVVLGLALGVYVGFAGVRARSRRP
jgi:membrane-associated phospholipid phosphatase